jgi:uncharacterized protein
MTEYLRVSAIGLLCALLAMTLASPAFSGFKAGAEAAGREDYQTALAEWLPLAESGDERAQYNIGLMYEYGRGVPEDQGKAFKWYRRAAEGGAVPAQHNLGTMYASGRAVAKDMVEAYKWFLVAAAAGFALSIDALEKAPQLISETEIEQARTMAGEWIKNFSPEIGT